MKLNLVHRICLTGLFLALTIILTRLIAIQNLPVIPFVRISLGPAFIIFSSILLGPLCGAIIGAGSDILGIVLFPNALGYAINPLFTVIYGLLGVIPWVIYYFCKKIKTYKIPAIILYVTMLALVVFVTVFLIMNNSMTLFGKTYTFEVWQKCLIIVLSVVLSIGTGIAIYFNNKMMIKKFGKEDVQTYCVALCCLVAEIITSLILNSIVKAFTYEVDFLFVFFVQAVVFFIDVPLNTFVVTYLLLLSKKIMARRI